MSKICSDDCEQFLPFEYMKRHASISLVFFEYNADMNEKFYFKTVIEEKFLFALLQNYYIIRVQGRIC